MKSYSLICRTTTSTCTSTAWYNHYIGLMPLHAAHGVEEQDEMAVRERRDALLFEC